MRFRRNHEYTVAIRVECSETTVKKLMVIPIMEGGGNELP